MRQGLGPLRLLGPSLDVHDLRQVSLAIDQEERAHPVAEPVEPLDRRQPGVEPRRPLRVHPAGLGGVVRRAEQQGPQRDPPVLVGRERGHPERLERGGDAEGVGEVEVFRDDHVFQDVVEPLRAVLDPEVEEPPEPQVEHLEDRRDQPTLGGEEGRRAPGLEQVTGAEPLDLHPEAVGVFEDR